MVLLQLRLQNIFQIYLKRGIRHDVLNAKNHEREAEIVAGAGQKVPLLLPGCVVRY